MVQKNLLIHIFRALTTLDKKALGEMCGGHTPILLQDLEEWHLEGDQTDKPLLEGSSLRLSIFLDLNFLSSSTTLVCHTSDHPFLPVVDQAGRSRYGCVSMNFRFSLGTE
jgi:hypothetical protein